MALKLLFAFVHVLVWVSVEAQEEIAEELLEQDPQTDEGTSYIETWLDQWHQQYPQLVNLNKITNEILSDIPWVTPIQARSLLRYITTNGPLITIWELQAVPGWDLATIRLLKPLVFVSEQQLTHDLRNLAEKLNTERNKYLLFRFKNQIEKAEGYRDPDGNKTFQGSSAAIMTRLRIHKSGDFGVGLTFEKDAGEPWFWNFKDRQLGFDFWSFHCLLQNKGPVQSLILGDYQVQWDQSLIMGMGFNLGSQVITGIRKVHRGIYPHTSMSESNFRRGVGLELRLGSITISGFYSRLFNDASVKDSLLDKPTHVTSVQSSGLHRNQNEIHDKNKLRVQELGFHLAYPLTEALKLAVSGVYQIWQWPILPSPRKYNAFHFNGKNNYNLGISAEYSWENINMFAQWAISKSGGRAQLMGIVASLSPQVSLALGTRDYQRHFHSIAGSAMGVNSTNINEKGVYWGLQLIPHLKWKLSGYFDLFSFPWLTFTADSPTQGYSAMWRVQYLHRKQSPVDLQWRVRFKQVNGTENPLNQTNGLVNQVKHQVILKSTWDMGENIILKSRLQWSTVKTGIQRTQGFLINHEIISSMGRFQLTLSNTLFNTQDFDNRQYIYERDLLYSLSLPAFEGLGLRWYFLSKAKISPKLQCWARVAQTFYRDRSQIGSGLDTITGAAKTDYRFQIQYKL